MPIACAAAFAGVIQQTDRHVQRNNGEAPRYLEHLCEIIRKRVFKGMISCIMDGDDPSFFASVNSRQ